MRSAIVSTKDGIFLTTVNQTPNKFSANQDEALKMEPREAAYWAMYYGGDVTEVRCADCGTFGSGHYCPADAARGECDTCGRERCICGLFCEVHDIEVAECECCPRCRYELNNDDAEVDSMSSLAIEGRG